jgi:hypothetical protein
MSRVYEYYRTPSQEEVEEQERLEYLRWYEEQKQKQNQEKSKENGKIHRKDKRKKSNVNAK